jgi:hypothetical protein
MGIKGSVGIGFADFTVQSPSGDFKIDRGTFLVGSIERAFVKHVYLTLTLSMMNAEGFSNYDYTGSVNYNVSDVGFRSSVTDLGLGLKFKLFDGYWFTPYLEGGGLAGYHQVTYTTKQSVLQGIGSDYKLKDSIMGSGYYGEAGVEIAFSERFGVKLAARKSEYDTKPLETLGNRGLRFMSETYYFSGLFGF